MFQLQVISPQKIIYSGEAMGLRFTGIGGETTILQNHMDFMTVLNIGEVIIETAEQTKIFTIGKGIFSMKNNQASLLIEDVVNSEELSEERANQAITKAKELVNKGVTGPDLEKALYTIRRSSVDLRHLQKYKKQRVY